MRGKKRLPFLESICNNGLFIAKIRNVTDAFANTNGTGFTRRARKNVLFTAQPLFPTHDATQSSSHETNGLSGKADCFSDAWEAAFATRAARYIHCAARRTHCAARRTHRAARRTHPADSAADYADCATRRIATS